MTWLLIPLTSKSPLLWYTLPELVAKVLVRLIHRKVLHGSHRLEKYLNIQDCLEKYLKIKFALKST